MTCLLDMQVNMLAFEPQRDHAMADQTQSFAVLTGDIVGSTALPPARLDAAMQVISSAARRVATWPGTPVTAFARRGGDSWQLAVADPALGLRLIYKTQIIQ